MAGQERIQEQVYDRAAQAIDQRRFVEAEQALRAALQDRPHDSRALGLLGLVLDAEKRFPEAETYYDLSLKLDAGSITVLNNLGNHYLVQGKSQAARQAYLRLVRLDPHHQNANLHLAEMSVNAHDGNSALHFIDQLPIKAKAQPAVEFLHAKALRLVGRTAAAEDLVERTEKQAEGDPRIPFSAGMMFVEWGRYEKAEQALGLALRLAPADTDILYNLGLAAARAGHLDGAQKAFETVLGQKRDDIDSLLSLSRIYVERGRVDEALGLLTEAQSLAPERPDILLSLARLTEKTGFYTDATAAYQTYLKLRPQDDFARRERGFVLARAGNLDAAISELRWYVEKHPKDPTGFYELAVAETVYDRERAREHLNSAVALDPNSIPARYARAVLNYQDNKPGKAVDDLHFVLRREPRNYRALDTLGEVDLALHREAQAEESFRKAVGLAPNDLTALIHYARVLQETGRGAEAEEVLNSLRRLALFAAPTAPHHGDLRDVLGLPASQSQTWSVASLQTRLAKDPNDLDLNLQLARALLAQGKTAEALDAFRNVRSLTSDPKVYAMCGKALLESQLYEPARAFLYDAVLKSTSGDVFSTDARLDLVVALFHSDGPTSALAELDSMLPVASKYKGDYYLLRAQVLDAMGESKEAVDDLNRGFRSSPTRSDLYLEGSLFLIKHGRYQEALDLIKQAKKLVPGSPQLLIAEAVVHEVLQRSDLAEEILERIQSRWPQWSTPYLLEGAILVSHFKAKEARSRLETALALGGDDATAYYYLALADTQTIPQDIPAAERAIERSLRLNPRNARACSLAGKIALSQKHYNAALDYLTSAIRLDPNFADPHEDLSALYRILGEKQKSIAELQEVLAIKQKKVGTSESPATISDLLFTAAAR